MHRHARQLQHKVVSSATTPSATATKATAKTAHQRPSRVHARTPLTEGQQGSDFVSAHRAFAPLTKGRPVFRITQPISVIHEPQSFYQELLRGISHARRRVYLSSLYLGSEENELISALGQALSRQPDLQVHILLDCLRGTRTDSQGMSSAALLAPLIAAHGADRVRVSMYHTPALSGLSKQAWPQRYNEAFGLQHIKGYIFDDDIIISGANLSRDYFTNRQDRYMRISDRQFVNYFAGLIDAIGQFSFRVAAGNRMQTLSSTNYRLEMPHSMPDPSQEPREFVREANEVMAQFLQRTEIENAIDEHDINERDTLAIPTVQMRQLGITQDEQHMAEFIELADAFARRHHGGCHNLMASAYFNFSEQYKSSVLSSPSQWELLVASPQANGFYAAKGISQFIPDMYSIIEHGFLRDVAKHGRNKDVAVAEYKRDGWTFHGKGVWCYLNQRLPQLIMVGSPNYGYRSIYRDLEAQVTLIPGSEHLRKDIHQEAQRLLAQSKTVSEPELRQRIRDTPLWVHGIKPFIMTKF
ncbi:CDP-diacylglycerol--glycerol-3-phosphate 3-phosphatidyltransferase [Coemansia guatemalensis]|uniref:CDP-diacylglycerol--glycerol-3-phosphate 3-phosphatidyltransferase n=1 Tax=Coemansia guatemalensis TaxID=2761395 RepID=A0A9W8HTZ0_9FUNG|nr:CDP-diacylglycerol--glycerol-3-phosphate 3-phosphatidyltransferase [Coemansia guatemalensis]